MADQLAGYWYRKIARKRGLIEKDKVDFSELMLERIAQFFHFLFLQILFWGSDKLKDNLQAQRPAVLQRKDGGSQWVGLLSM